MFGGNKKKLTATKSGIRVIPKTRRESFLPSDKAWLESKPKIEPGEYVGEGAQGVVYTVKGNPNMIVKVPKPFKHPMLGKYQNTSSRRREVIREDEDDFNEEWQKYVELDLYDEPLIIPTKAIKVKSVQVKGSFPGLVRPKVTIIGLGSKRHVPTDEEFEQIRQKLILLSARGITLTDGLQIGIDRIGRIQLYDTGFIQDRTPKRAAQKNQVMWEWLLAQFDKSIAQYGMINPSGRGGARYLS
jgi:hypothetical protein